MCCRGLCFCDSYKHIQKYSAAAIIVQLSGRTQARLIVTESLRDKKLFFVSVGSNVQLKCFCFVNIIKKIQKKVVDNFEIGSCN